MNLLLQDQKVRVALGASAKCFFEKQYASKNNLERWAESGFYDK